MPKLLNTPIDRLKTLLKLPYLALRKNKVDTTSHIGENSFFRSCRIGKWCFIGPKGTFNNVEIGNYTCIAPSCQIGGMEHPYWEASISPRLSNSNAPRKTTHIGHDVWIAANCVIRQGVTIGDGAVIGACSFVNTDVPPYAIVFGIPAKIYKFRFDKPIINKLNESHYWEYEPKKAKSIIDKISIHDNSHNTHI